ncbi:ABC transporter permease [Ktedonosporobacter rubrisoli]|uniref:Transport permease protein n=1 Tax=Ktedonosporobacter rubrisoli TaxID=2509675 RepID=A0A4P6JIF0_KTERU|nr:ABC transporter permease [Ktedonosporobacter rubrisoli]QBD74753.1 ABC transporter permease [Ktedonosporobacter rubrisoli]
MTIDISAMPRTPLARLRWALLDSWTVALRDLNHWVRQPMQLIFNLLFLVMLVLMFGFLFGGGMLVPGGGNYRDFLMPGMFVMTMFFGIEATCLSVITDTSRGVTDRFRSMPMASAAVVLGRCIADMLNSLLSLVAMILCGLLVGWRWHGSLGGAVMAIGLLLLLRFALLWVGIYLGLLLKTPEAVGAVQILVWPVSFLSSTFASPATMPGWLGTLVEWNPLSSSISATRELFGNAGWGGASWIAQHGLLMAIVWPLALTIIFFPLSVYAYQRLSR